MEAFVNLGIAGSSIAWHQNRSTGARVDLTGSTTLNANQWYHVAVVINSNTLKLYVDGTSDGSVTNNEVFNNNDVMTIGGNADHIAATNSIGFVNKGATGGSSNKWFLYFAGAGGGITFKGQISNLRFVKGTAVYTSNFTPPTAPVTAITNTKLLLNMADGQAIDSAAQNNLTLAGNANTSTDQAKFGDTSLHLDGSGDYVNVLPSGRGNIYNYTVEQWLYPTRNYSGSGNFDRIWSSGTALNNSVMLHLDNTTAPKIVLRSNDSIIWTSSVSISLNAWTHVAVSCDADGTRLYIAGTERGTSSTVVNLRNLAFNIGTSDKSQGFFQGYIDDFRISDFARYTSNFTAPTAAFADKGQ